MRGDFQCSFFRRGLTLAELLAALGIIAVLATIVLFSLDGFRARIESAKCLSNLRNIYVGLSALMADKKVWPQIPEDMDESDAQALFWRRTLAPYGVDAGVWRCPTAARMISRSPEAEAVDIDYTPAEFDELESTPFKHPNQPWVVEAGDFHGDGNLLILTSGEALSFNEFYRRQTGNKPPWAR